jgi:hypothetical protein
MPKPKESASRVAMRRQLLEQELGADGRRAAVAYLPLIRSLQSRGLLPPELKAAVTMAAQAAPHWLRVAANIKASGKGDQAAAFLQAQGLGELWGVLDRAAPSPSASDADADRESSMAEQWAQLTPEQQRRAEMDAAAAGHPNLRRDIEAFRARAAERRATWEAETAAGRHARDKDPVAAWLASPEIQRQAPGWLAALGVKAKDGETPAAALLEELRGSMARSTDHAATITNIAARVRMDRGQVARALESIAGADVVGGLLTRRAESDKAEAKNRKDSRSIPRSDLSPQERARIDSEQHRRALLEKAAEGYEAAQRPVIENSSRKAALRIAADQLEGKPSNWTPSKRLLAEVHARDEAKRNRPVTPTDHYERAYDHLAAKAEAEASAPPPEREFRPRNEVQQASERRSALESAYDAAAGTEGETP